PVDGYAAQLGQAGHHVDFLAVALRWLPNVLQLHGPLFPGKADIVRTGRNAHTSRHSLIDNGLRRRQIGRLDLVVLGASNRSRVDFGTVDSDDEGVGHIIALHARITFLDATDEPTRQLVLGVRWKNVADHGAADGSERQAVDVSVLAELTADGMFGCARLHLW